MKNTRMTWMYFGITPMVMIVCLLFVHKPAYGQELLLYQQIDTSKLFLEMYKPPAIDDSQTYPAMVFYFGGGWNGGTRTQFQKQAEYFSQRGIICFLADYRTLKNGGVQPFECLKDAKSAMRYIRANASELNVDPGQVIASGGSAGGHLAAATAIISGFNHDGDNQEISCIPNALVLFNPVIDNGPGGYGYDRIGDQYQAFSPLHNLDAGVPPTIIFLGTNDKLIPVTTMEYYQLVMEKIGVKCELHLYEDQAHGFFNYRNLEYYKKTVRAADDFLTDLGYLSKEPIMEIK